MARNLARYLQAGAVCLLTACSSAAPTVTPAPETVAGSPGTTLPGATPHRFTVGAFPPFPEQALPEAAELQREVDAAVAGGRLTGVTASVIVAGRGSWSGAAGAADGVALIASSRRPTHSSAKTVVAAQVLRLVDDGLIGLDDLASKHLPPEMDFFDANGATVRQVLGMRSGIPALDEFTPEGGYYPAERAPTAIDVFKMLPKPEASPGGLADYASTNYVLLGLIIEHVSGRPLAEAVRSDVLDRPGLDGLVYTVDNALAGDGWGVASTTGSLARWGYELYGGFVLSEASLRQMLDFGGDWYGLGVMDLSDAYGTLAVGHEGSSSAGTCCSVIRLVALPGEGIVISVQASTPAASSPYESYNAGVVRLTQVLRDATGLAAGAG